MLKRNTQRVPEPKVESSGVPKGNPDPFDRLYERWAEQAYGERLGPPSREMWDKIILFLLSSKDSQRIRLYRHIEAEGPDRLGSDAYELWRKVPNYTVNKSIPFTNWADFNAYAKAHEGSMRQVMEKEGLGERYNTILSANPSLRSGLKADSRQALEEAAARKAQAKRGQAGVLTMGCIGLFAIAFMALTVLLIIGLRLLS